MNTVETAVVEIIQLILSALGSGPILFDFSDVEHTGKERTSM